MPDIGWRQINESSSKKDGIEFFATHRDEYKSKHPRIAIDKVVFALPSPRADHAPYLLAGLDPNELIEPLFDFLSPPELRTRAFSTLLSRYG